MAGVQSDGLGLLKDQSDPLHFHRGTGKQVRFSTLAKMKMAIT